MKRTAATFSLAFLAVAAVSGPGAPKKMKTAPHKNGAKHKGHTASVASHSHSRSKQTARASAQTLAERENYSLGRGNGPTARRSVGPAAGLPDEGP